MLGVSTGKLCGSGDGLQTGRLSSRRVSRRWVEIRMLSQAVTARQDAVETSLQSEVRALGMGEFSPAELDAIARILSGLDVDRRYPNDFGAEPPSCDLGSLVTGNPTTDLSDAAKSLKIALEKANPESVMKSRGAVARWTGRAAETELTYRVACSNIDQLVAEAKKQSAGARDFAARLCSAVPVVTGSLALSRAATAAWGGKHCLTISTMMRWPCSPQAQDGERISVEHDY